MEQFDLTLAHVDQADALADGPPGWSRGDGGGYQRVAYSVQAALDAVVEVTTRVRQVEPAAPAG